MAFTVSRVAVSTTAVSVLAGVSPPGGYAGGVQMYVRNSGPNTAWLGPAGVTAANGYPLPTGTELNLAQLNLDSGDTLFAICAAAETAALAVLQVN